MGATPDGATKRGFTDTIKKQGWWLPHSGDASDSSHFLLNGGKLLVPDEQNGRFLNVYFQSFLRKEYLCVVERRTPIFRLFFDIDAKFSETVDENIVRRDMLDFCCLLHECVTDFFCVEESSSECIVCEAPPKSLQDGMIKFGLHVVFPEVYVNTKIARLAREAFLEACQGKYAQALSQLSVLPQNPLHDVIDECVYKANGLRMPWSYKSIHEQRPYIPKHCIRPGGSKHTFEQEELTLQNTRILLFKCSIRLTNVMNLTPCKNNAHLIADRLDEAHRTSGIPGGVGTSLDMYQQAFPEIRRVLPPVYKNVSFVGKAFVTDSAVMLKTNSRYCFNKGGEHATSTVYFCITRHGIRQQCYCRKSDVRQEGVPCSEYRGNEMPLSKECLSVFFPDAFLPDPDTIKLESSTATRKSFTLDSILKRSRFLNPKSSGSSANRKKSKHI